MASNLLAILGVTHTAMYQIVYSINWMPTVVVKLLVRPVNQLKVKNKTTIVVAKTINLVF